MTIGTALCGSDNVKHYLWKPGYKPGYLTKVQPTGFTTNVVTDSKKQTTGVTTSVVTDSTTGYWVEEIKTKALLQSSVKMTAECTRQHGNLHQIMCTTWTQWPKHNQREASSSKSCHCQSQQTGDKPDTEPSTGAPRLSIDSKTSP